MFFSKVNYFSYVILLPMLFVTVLSAQKAFIGLGVGKLEYLHFSKDTTSYKGLGLTLLGSGSNINPRRWKR